MKFDIIRNGDSKQDRKGPMWTVLGKSSEYKKQGKVASTSFRLNYTQNRKLFMVGLKTII